MATLANLVKNIDPPVEITQADYAALPAAQKQDGTEYYITDGSGSFQIAATTPAEASDGTGSNVQVELDKRLEASKLVNGGTTTAAGYALDARFGKTLNDQVQDINSRLNGGDGTGFADMQWRMKNYRVQGWQNVFLFRKETEAMFIHIPWPVVKKSNQTISISVDTIQVEYNDTAGHKYTAPAAAPVSIAAISEHTVVIRMPIVSGMSALTSQVGICTIATTFMIAVSTD